MQYGSKTSVSGEPLKGESTFTPITAGERNPGFTFVEFVMVEGTTRANLVFDKGGKQFKKTIFQDDREWAIEQANRTLLHIATKMGDEESFYKAIEGATGFENWVERCNNYLKKASKGKTFTLKIIYRGQYLDFPKFPNFIELDGTNPSTLSTNPTYDKYEKQVSTTSETPTESTVENDVF